MVIIPTKSFPSYVETITLENIVYQFEFNYNSREEAWFMSISRDDEPLIAGIKVVDNFELIGRFANVLLPRGLILTVDIEGLQRPPGQYELGSAVKLAYLTESEALSGIIQ